MTSPNWAHEAMRALELNKRALFEAHRGAFAWHAPTKTMVLFGNQGQPHEVTKVLRLRCDEAGITVRAIAICDESYSFAMLVEHADEGFMTRMLNEASKSILGEQYNESNFGRYQQSVAAARIGQFFVEP